MSAELRIAMEWGFKAHEKGMNLQAAQMEFEKLLQEEQPRPEEPAPWRTLKEETQERLATLQIELVMDDPKDVAHSLLDSMELPELAWMDLADTTLSTDDPDPTDEQVQAWITENVIP